jgi:citronellol/citronellal dehydrogenase
MAYDSIFKADLFAGFTVIVTGGGRGIGRCTAHELAALGAHVLLVGRKADKLKSRRRNYRRRRQGRLEHLRYSRGRCGDASGWRTDPQARPDPRSGQQCRRAVPVALASINQKGFETVMRTNLVGGFLMARKCSTSP